MAANARNAVNLTEDSRAALTTAVSSIVEAARPTAPVPVENPQDVSVRWITKLESQKGPAARRAVLAQALASIVDSKVRDQLLLEASRIEVDAVLAKVEGLKTATAKRRHLQAALDALKADAVADDLQSQQIKWLGDALEELEEKDTD